MDGFFQRCEELIEFGYLKDKARNLGGGALRLKCLKLLLQRSYNL